MVIFLVLVLFTYLFALITWTTLGGIDISRALFAGVYLFFLPLGAVLNRIPRNRWVGVRTPWTLGSDRVWDDTHRLAGKVFVAAGLIGFVAAILCSIQVLVVGESLP